MLIKSMPIVSEYKQVAYVSSALNDALDDAQLYDIAQVCQKRNAERQLTGLLIYRDGCVFQILEGKVKDVDDVFNMIQSDYRHYNIITVMNRMTEKRDFPFWNFAFRNYTFTSQLQARLVQDEKKFCSEEQLNQFDRMMLEFKQGLITNYEMSRQAANLIETFQRTILRHEPVVVVSKRKQKSNIWSRPTLSRSNTIA